MTSVSFEQAALLQVEHQGGAGLIDVVADFLEVVVQVLAGAAVAVPVGVVELHEPHAALDEPAGEQAVGGERRLARLDAVEVERLGRFLREVHQLRALVCMRNAIS